MHRIQFGNKQSITYKLSWNDDWGAYPTNDLDLILEAPDGTFIFTGASFNSPETVTIPRPQAGLWTMYVIGFTVFDATEQYVLRWE